MLGELIKKRAVELGGRKRLTYRELSARARAQGYALAEGTITDFANHPLVEPPRRRTMRALAAALDVPYNTVVEAVAESMAEDGDVVVQVADAPHVQAWVMLTEGRSDAERQQMIGVMRSVAAALDASRAHETTRETDTEITHIEDAGRSRRSRGSR